MTRRLLVPTLALALLATPMATTTAYGAPAGDREVRLTAAAAPETRVLAISVDGLNPRSLRRLGAHDAPTFHRLRKEGAGTLNARTVVEYTVTLPNHASMMTGRRVDAAKGGHGVTWDNDRRGSTVHQAAGHHVTSVFEVVHQADELTALFASKRKFSLYNRSWPGSIDAYRVDEDSRRLTKAVRSDLLHHDRAFTFLHLADPDRAGHAFGFMSRRYLAAVRRTDARLEMLLRAIDKHQELSDELVVVLTADHGGIGRSHHNRNRKGNYTIPFLVWGAGVSHGNLYAMNPGYSDPGGKQPSYAGAQPIRNGDLANLATDLLGLGPVPGSLFDADQSLSVGPG